NRGETGKQADLAEQYLAKGKQVYLEGKLDLDTWDDKNTGQKRQKHRMIVDVMQFLDSGQAGGGARSPAPAGAASGSGGDYNSGSGGGEEYDSGPPSSGGGTNEEIPF